MISIEDMARADIRKYMTPCPSIGFPGVNQEIAVRKAAAHWTRKSVIEHIGSKEILAPFTADELK